MSISTSQLTLSIITRNRTAKLSRCLQSIVQQQLLPKEVLIIDNDPQESARNVYQAFCQKLSLRYVMEPRMGYPFARNAAIRNCQSDYIGFVDDDCVLDADWTINAERVLNEKNAVFVVGRTLLLNEGNIIAEAQYQTYYEWFILSIDQRTHQIAPECLDTKNIVLRKTYLDKENIRFDERFIRGCEDVDLGLQLFEKGVRGYYVPTMRLWHEEVTDFRDFLYRSYQRGRLSCLLALKWNPKGLLMKLEKIKAYYWVFLFVVLPIGFGRLLEKRFARKLTIYLLNKLHFKAYILGFLIQRNKKAARSQKRKI